MYEILNFKRDRGCVKVELEYHTLLGYEIVAKAWKITENVIQDAQKQRGKVRTVLVIQSQKENKIKISERIRRKAKTSFVPRRSGGSENSDITQAYA